MLQISKTTKEVLNAAAQFFVKTAKEAILKQGKFTVALSGGSSPKGLFELLAADFQAEVEWNKVFSSLAMSVMFRQIILTATP